MIVSLDPDATDASASALDRATVCSSSPMTLNVGRRALDAE
jgi:hypothetical protein